MKNSIIGILKQGGVAVIPTDTIYGLVGQALNKKTVKQIYRLKRRTPTKPFIILISSLVDLKKFGVHLNSSKPTPEGRLSDSSTTSELLNSFWPGKVSVILPCATMRLRYLHRGTNSLAFRLPKPVWLRNLLKKTGPLVAPSANPEGLKPATTISQAKKYFHNHVDFYVNGGKKVSKPSTLISIEKEKVVVLRQGAVRINC
ncbi:MAG: L-threonylcarbamoyladenylate synthase [bacterium]|nr:L-threonylcarbamoyladenylate synthase [bacterium]